VWNRLWIPALATAVIGVLVVVVVRRGDQGIRPIEPGTATPAKTSLAAALAATSTQIVTAPPSIGTTRCANRAVPLRKTTK